MKNIYTITLLTALISNFIALNGLSAGRLMINHRKAKHYLSHLAVALSIPFLLYILGLLFGLITALCIGNIPGAIICLILLPIPFFIGKLAEYNTAIFFINLQIATLCISLWMLAFLLDNVL